jgi:hypothetical protein
MRLYKNLISDSMIGGKNGIQRDWVDRMDRSKGIGGRKKSDKVIGNFLQC